MAANDAFTAGVRPGGLTNSTEIRLLLCYLVKNAGPITRTEIENALMEIEDYEFNRLLDHYNIHPEVTYDTTSDFALLSMVEAGLGVGIVHSLLIKPGRYRVAALPLNVKQSREIGIAVKKGFLPSTITQLFLQHVVDYTKDMGEITVVRH